MAAVVAPDAVASLKLPRRLSFLLLLGVEFALSALEFLLDRVSKAPLQRLLRRTPLKMSSGERKFIVLLDLCAFVGDGC